MSERRERYWYRSGDPWTSLTDAEVLAEMGGQQILWCETHQLSIAASGHYCLGWSVNAGCREVEAWLVVNKEDDE